MIRLLFVCLGNICRSPAAEGVARRLADARGVHVDLDSAGVGDWHAGEHPDLRMQDAALKRGYDIGSLRARQVKAEDFMTFDHILAMDEGNYAALERLRPEGAHARLSLMMSHAPESGVREVPDPYYGGPGGFDNVLDLLEDSVGGLLDEVAAAQR